MSGRTVLIATLTDHIRALQPFCRDLSDTLWFYERGVWRMDKGRLRSIVTDLLKDKYKQAHLGNVLS